ncbi:hypothetical protein SK128_008815 [Halocaridina rubra]|uniref:Uncharacterized protein n=1 Tax=Halocaridina rubra TaxID=373956 RepID=A0AAN8X6U0_HALRR
MATYHRLLFFAVVVAIMATVAYAQWYDNSRELYDDNSNEYYGGSRRGGGAGAGYGFRQPSFGGGRQGGFNRGYGFGRK